MSFGTRRVFARTAAIIDRRLTNCHVEIGSSAGWLDNVLRVPVAPLSTDAAENLSYAGIFSAYHEEALDTEGYQLSVSLPAVVAAPNAQFEALIRHGDRVAIKMLDYPEYPRLICKVRNSQPDGQYRALHYLHGLGPECDGSEDPVFSFPYTYPVVFGAVTSSQCYNLDVLNPLR